MGNTVQTYKEITAVFSLVLHKLHYAIERGVQIDNQTEIDLFLWIPCLIPQGTLSELLYPNVYSDLVSSYECSF